jgi:hypothetical protein
MAGGLDCRSGIERVIRFDQVQTRKSRARRDCIVVPGRCRRYRRLGGETGEAPKDGERKSEFAAEISVAGRLEQACVKEPAFGEKRVAVRIRADAECEFDTGLLAGDIVLEIGVDGLVLEIQLPRERQQKNLVLERCEVEGFPLRRLIARLRKVVADFGCARRLSNERVNLLVADVEAAELIEGETIARAQTKDLTMQEDVEAQEFVIEVLIDHGASG